MGYIDKEVAEKAIAALMPSMSTPDGSGENDHLVLAAQEMCVDAMETIHELPEVDATPVLVHGHWKFMGMISGDDWWKCSVCGRIIQTNMFKRLDRFPYCHCGAKMDLEE